MMWTLVTGGALHLGAEVCRAAAYAGKNIVIQYRNSEKEALCLREELEAYGVAAQILRGDFSTLKSTRLFLDEYGERFLQTEAVINNVGNYSLGSASLTSPEQFCALLQVNTIAPLTIIQSLLPSLKHHCGKIVNIGIAGAQNGAANTHATAYNLTKLSLAMLTKSLAKELAVYAVSVNMVSPGYLEDSIDLPSDMAKIPAGRLGRYEEVAKAVVFFLTQENVYITGQILEVAGGTRL